MYKEIIICSVVIIAIVTTNWFLQDYTKNSVTEISNKLEELEQDLKEKNKTKVQPKIEDIKNTWEEQYGVLAVFIEHDELEKVETNLVAIKAFIDVEDFNMGINEVNKSIFILKHIAEKYDFSLVNVF